MSVRTLVKSIRNIMRQDTGVDGDAQRISQLCWMFFLKIIDDQDQELELMQPGYASPIPEWFQWRAWAADPEGITGEAHGTSLRYFGRSVQVAHDARRIQAQSAAGQPLRRPGHEPGRLPGHQYRLSRRQRSAGAAARAPIIGTGGMIHGNADEDHA